MDSENKERAKGKDYGFPFVEVVPVRPLLNEAIVEALVQVEEIPVEEIPVEEIPVEEIPVEEIPVEEIPVEEIPVEEIPVEEIPVEEIPVEEIPVEEIPVEEISVGDLTVEELPVEELPVEKTNPIEIKRPEKIISRPAAALEKKKKSQSPVLLFLILFMVVIMMAMAYFLYFLPNKQQEQTPLITEETVVVEEPPFLMEEEEVMAEESASDQPIEALDAPTGQVMAGEIILITEKGPRPSYYIIAGSLPNERLAREDAQKWLNKGSNVWLISPSGDTRNYRISVGKYDYFQSATEALEKAKLEFDESLWILKY